MLVLLPDVIFLGKIDQVDDWLCCQQHERIDDLDLGFIELAIIRHESDDRCAVFLDQGWTSSQDGLN